MLAVTLGVALTAVLLLTAWSRSGWNPADLGVMSHQWLANYNASRPSSSL